MSNQPTFVAYSVIERAKGKEPHWHRIGAAWRHKEGEGFSLQLDSLPLDGRITLLPPKAKADAEGGEA